MATRTYYAAAHVGTDRTAQHVVRTFVDEHVGECTETDMRAQWAFHALTYGESALSVRRTCSLPITSNSSMDVHALKKLPTCFRRQRLRRHLRRCEFACAYKHTGENTCQCIRTGMRSYVHSKHVSMRLHVRLIVKEYTPTHVCLCSCTLVFVMHLASHSAGRQPPVRALTCNASICHGSCVSFGGRQLCVQKNLVNRW